MGKVRFHARDLARWNDRGRASVHEVMGKVRIVKSDLAQKCPGPCPIGP